MPARWTASVCGPVRRTRWNTEFAVPEDKLWKNLEWHCQAETTALKPMDLIRAWERDRLMAATEHSLVVLANSEAFEREGIEYQTTFDGWDNQELIGAVLCHTHRRGLPPSIADISVLLRLPLSVEFRVARFGLATSILRRVSIVDYIDTCDMLMRVRRRVRAQRQVEWSEELQSQTIWSELMPILGRLGIEWNEELT